MFSSSIEIFQKRVNKQQATTWKGAFDMRWLLTGCSSLLLFLEPLLIWRRRSQMELKKTKERTLSWCLKAEPSEYERLLNYLRKVHQGQVTSQPKHWKHLGDVVQSLSTDQLSCHWTFRLLWPGWMRTYMHTKMVLKSCRNKSVWSLETLVVWNQSRSGRERPGYQVAVT